MLLFLHGFMGSKEEWHAVTSELTDAFRCLAVDLPGHGRSVELRDPVAYSIEGASDRILELLDDRSVARCTVVGYSMGGRTALYLACYDPGRFERVVLESASPGWPTEAERRERREQDEALARKLGEGDLASFLNFWYDQPLFDSVTRDEERRKALLARRMQNDPRELALSLRGAGSGVQRSLWDELPLLKMPMDLIVGEHDAKYRQIAREMVRLSNRGRVVIVPQAGHNVHLENRGGYLKALRDCLAESSTPEQ